jgi:hypothetical protein
MAEDITKVSAVEAEEPKTMAEKEETVAENAGVSLEDGVYKLDLNKVNEQNQEQDAVQEQETKDGVLRGSSENEEAGQETEMELQGVRKEEEIETPIIEQITDETNTTNETGVDGSTEVADPAPEQEEVLSEEKTQEPVNLPENIQNLVNFMEETGGTIEDFVSLNTDFSNVDDNTLMVEYYKKTKPHLSYDEISFLMEDKFSIDEEIDEERDVKSF